MFPHKVRATPEDEVSVYFRLKEEPKISLTIERRRNSSFDEKVPIFVNLVTHHMWGGPYSHELTNHTMICDLEH